MKSMHTVKILCRVLRVSRSGFYTWINAKPARTAKDHIEHQIIEIIAPIYQKSRCTYGHRSIREELAKKGIAIGRRLVLRIMKKQGMRAIPLRPNPYAKLAKANEHAVCKNRLRRNFKASSPNRYWVGDITYLWTGQGWIYLATVLDLYSRRIVGWAISDKPDTELAIRALDNALQSRPHRPWRLMFHSDQGCQYTSKELRTYLRGKGILQSMSRRGQCWDNAAMESFFGTLKQETGLGKWPLDTAEETKYAIFEWIEAWYNVTRRHSTLGYCSPAEFELKVKKVA